MTRLSTAVMVVSAIAAAYPFAIYPLILWLQARSRRRECPETEGPRALPSFTVIIPAHNEERIIGPKLSNTLAAARVAEAPFQIIVAADGCTDRTCAIVRQYPEVELIEVEKRGGIVGAFKAGLAHASHDIVFFSDADIQLDPNTFTAMLRHFLQPKVGGVCGSTRMEIVSGSGLTAERVNVAYRRWIRLHQSLVHSSIGADGANWALRRSLIQFPEGQLAEDLVMPLEVVHAGYRFVYEPDGGALETSPGSVADEYHRKVRTIAGGIQAGLCCRWMFKRPHAATGFHYVSWKICKYAVPAWLALGYTAALATPPLSTVAALVGVIVIVWILAGRLARAIMPQAPGWLTLPWYALVVAATPFAAVVMLVRRRVELRWRMAAR